ncbi:transmembrane protease serine 11B-like protein [Glandiceps talaboti]
MRVLIVLSLLAVSTVLGQDSGCGNDRFYFGISGSFTSMNFDGGTTRYDRNAYCYWVLETSTAFGQAIDLEFDYFDLEASVNCIYDSVIAYDGIDSTSPELRRMCGHSLPNPTISTLTVMSVEFITDGSVEFYGFDATWVARDQPIECESEVAYRCGDDRNGYCIPIEERCDGKQDCALGEDELGCPTNSARCGRPNIDPNLNATSVGINIVGGSAAEAGSWPWMAAIQQTYEHQCGATIIDNTWVLTAAHCVYLYRTNPQVFDIVSGNHIYTQPDPFETVHDVDEIFIHTDYSPLKEEWNFALLKVRGIIGFLNDYHLDVCLPGKDDLYPEGTQAWITGWGDTISVTGSEDGTQDTGSNVLLQGQVEVHSADYCNDPSRHNGDVTESLVCADSGDGPKDACTGDDGGPMVWYREDGGLGNPDDNRWYLIGVIGDRSSDGFNCANPDKPGLHGYVPSAIDWIESTMTTN